MAKNSLKISVVMPSYNCVQYIERAIKSVIEQDYQNFDLFIKDGGSKDGTVEVIKFYAKKYPKKIKWVSKKDKGQTDAINTGIKSVNGDIIAWLNCDDVYKPGTFKAVSKYFDNNPASMWVYGKCDIIDSEDRPIRSLITSYKNFWLEHYNYQILLILNFISQMGVFWRKEIHKQVGLLDPKQFYVMDYDNWLRVGKVYNPGFINKYLGSFRIIPSSKSSTGFIKQFQDELEVAKKYTNNSLILFLHGLHIKLITSVYLLLRFVHKFSPETKNEA